MTARDKPAEVAVPPPDSVLIAFTHVPDEAIARAIAQALVDEKLAACVNILAPCTSIYRWEGEVECAQEWPLVIKTTRNRFAALQARLRDLHPYELPDLMACTPTAVLPDYAAWVIRETRRSPVGTQRDSRSQRATSSEK